MSSTIRLVRLSRAHLLLLLLLIFAAQPPALASYQQIKSGPVERYGGEAQIGSEAPIPVHLEIRRSAGAVEGVISSSGAEFSLENARGKDEVTATLGGAGGGPISLQFAGDQVRGQFKLGELSGKLQATRTSKSAAEFFKAPEQRLDLSLSEWREDLDRLVEMLTTQHGSPFHHASRRSFERELQRVRAALPRLSAPQVAVEFRRLAAMIGDGHTSVARPVNRPRVPLETYWFEDGIRAVAIVEEHRDLLGAKLTGVAGVSIAEVLRRLTRYAPQGESPWSYRYLAPFLISDADVLSNAGIGSGAVRTFTFELMDGSSRDIAIAATTQRTERAVLGGSPPLWRREPNESFRILRLPAGRIYVNWRSYEVLPERARALLQEIEQQRPRRLIIDLRDSGGGDFNIGREFIQKLAGKPWLNRPDRLFVLTGRRTFSAAMTNAVDFRKMTRATLIGEPPGAAPNNWQEVRFFHLPNSGLRVGVSTTYYEFLPGEEAVRPDLFIPPTPSDWGAEHDAAVRYVLALPCPGAD